MQRFAGVLASQLPGLGIEAECICPSPVFGRLRPGSDGLGKFLGYLDKFVLFPHTLGNRVRRASPDVLVHICDHSNAIYTRVLAGIPHLVTCHDLIAIRSALGEFTGRRVRLSGRFYQRWILQGLNTAGQAACVSAATRRDLLRLTSLAPRQVSLVHNGLNHGYSLLSEAEAEGRLREAGARLGRNIAAKLQAGFILHVGGNQWYKNRPGLIQIYAGLCQKMSHAPNLVMAGQPLTPGLRRSISSHRLEDRVIELNSVSNQDLETLYNAAQLLLFPSSTEGFGWPIIEAHACGCRVVIAAAEPMTEIGGDAAVSFKLECGLAAEDAPLSTESADSAVRAVMKTLLETRQERSERVQSGLRNAARFSTTRMMDGYRQLYQQVLGGGTESPHHIEAVLEPS